MSFHKDIYIFGASGLIGKKIIKSMADDTNIFKVGRSIDSDIYLELAAPDLSSLSKIKKGSTFIFLSAISSPDECENNYRNAYLINVVNTKKIISYLLEQNIEVLFASSDIVYGEREEPVDESSSKNPISSYAKMKSEIEDTFINKSLFYVMRLSYVFSSNDKYSIYLKETFAAKKTVHVFHPFIRAIIHIDDVVSFVRCFLRKNKKDFPKLTNLCGNSLLSKLDITHAYSKKYNLKVDLSEPPDEFFKTRPRIINIKSKFLRLVLGKSPKDVIESIIK